MAKSSSEHQFEVREIQTKEEYARLVDVLWTANFQPYNPIFTAVHPVTGHTAADRKADKALDTEIRWAAHTKNPASHLIYVLDRHTGRVAGGCEWLIFHENPFPHGPQRIPCTWYPEGSERAEYTSTFLSQVFFYRMSWLQRPHAGMSYLFPAIIRISRTGTMWLHLLTRLGWDIGVNAMGVHPDYRRRGVGRLLMQWGHEQIDDLGYESFIEGSPMGRWLYEEFGYRRVVSLHVDLEKRNPSEEWSRLLHECRPPAILLLWRPPGGNWDGNVPDGPWAVEDGTWK